LLKIFCKRLNCREGTEVCRIALLDNKKILLFYIHEKPEGYKLN
jgi:hypothetical protein